MELFSKYFLVVYFFLVFGLMFALPTYRVWKSTGVNPYKLGNSDSAHDYVGRYFRVTLIACGLVVIASTFWPSMYEVFLPVPFLLHPIIFSIGQFVLVLSLVWILIAQAHMQRSWRIGIDEDVKTDLVQRGLFKVSRNPIFLGMRVMLLGLFLALPNAVTFAVMMTGEILIQIQVRLEEEFLTRTHGQPYLAYQKQVRRWI